MPHTDTAAALIRVVKMMTPALSLSVRTPKERASSSPMASTFRRHRTIIKPAPPNRMGGRASFKVRVEVPLRLPSSQ